jgi:hypothetical protein
VRPDVQRDATAAGLVALLAFLPFLRGVLSGASLYFRDLSLHFLPLRRFALEGLARGELRLWNPLVHEGVPLSLPALGYPLDALQLLRPDEAGISLALALHLPLAAIAFLCLARGLGLDATAAAGGAIVYALGGFLLSSVNLYVYLQAAAWAPLVVLALVRLLASGSARAVALAAVPLAVALSTTGVEIVGQAVLAGLVLGWPARDRARRAAAAILALLLAVALAAPVLLLVASQVEGSARGHGFSTDVVLAHSVHPFTLLQTLVAGLYGNPANLANEWWGQNFFPRGFPYVLSLYLGPAALAFALLGSLRSHSLRGRLLALGVFGIWTALGPWGGLAPLVEALPALRVVRFPVKAFFTVHLAAAVLAAFGVQAVLHEGRRAWGRLALAAGLPALALAALLPLAHALPGAGAAFAAGFFPAGYDAATRAVLLDRVLLDAAGGASLALLLSLVALAARRQRLGPSRAAALSLAIVAADLLRAGGGLNPMVSASFFRPSPELAARSAQWRAGRLFTCSVEDSPAYRQARAARAADHELWTFATLLETATPAFNVALGVPTAMSPDLTMLVPEDRTLSPEEASCRNLDAVLPRLRAAGVDRVLSVAPLLHPDLAPEPLLRPARLAPLLVHPYRLSRAAATLQLRDAAQARPTGVARLVSRRPDQIEVEVDAPVSAQLVLLEGWSRGWRAEIDGREAEVARVSGSHLGVSLPPGRCRVALRFAPRPLPAGVAISGLAALALAWLAWRRAAPAPTAG